MKEQIVWYFLSMAIVLGMKSLISGGVYRSGFVLISIIVIVLTALLINLILDKFNIG